MNIIFFLILGWFALQILMAAFMSVTSVLMDLEKGVKSPETINRLQFSFWSSVKAVFGFVVLFIGVNLFSLMKMDNGDFLIGYVAYVSAVCTFITCWLILTATLTSPENNLLTWFSRTFFAVLTLKLFGREMASFLGPLGQGYYSLVDVAARLFEDLGLVMYAYQADVLQLLIFQPFAYAAQDLLGNFWLALIPNICVSLLWASLFCYVLSVTPSKDK